MATLEELAGLSRITPPLPSNLLANSNNPTVKKAVTKAAKAIANERKVLSNTIATQAKVAKATNAISKTNNAIAATTKTVTEANKATGGLFGKSAAGKAFKKLSKAKVGGKFSKLGTVKGLGGGIAGSWLGGKIGDTIAEYTDDTEYDDMIRTGGNIAGGIAGMAATKIPYIGPLIGLAGGLGGIASLLGFGEDDAKPADKKLAEDIVQVTQPVQQQGNSRRSADQAQLDKMLLAIASDSRNAGLEVLRNLERRKRGDQVIQDQAKLGLQMALK